MQWPECIALCTPDCVHHSNSGTQHFVHHRVQCNDLGRHTRAARKPLPGAANNTQLYQRPLSPPVSSTGWSKETVNCNFSPTDLKDTKYSITQWVLESLHREVLILWCLKRVRWKKILPFRVVLKWWVGLVLTWSRTYLAHIYTLIHPQSAPTSQNIT